MKIKEEDSDKHSQGSQATLNERIQAQVEYDKKRLIKSRRKLREREKVVKIK